MKLDRIIFEPKAIIRFTREEVNALKRLSEGHYDGKCRSLSVPGDGAIINGLLNSFEVEGDVEFAEWTCLFRDVDLLAKVCEQAVYYTTPEHDWIRKTGIRLHTKFLEVMKQLADARHIVNGAGDLVDRAKKGRVCNVRKFEIGCVGVPRGDGTFFSTIYDAEGYGCFTAVDQFNGLARAVFNFSSKEEAEIVTPKIVVELNRILGKSHE